MAQESVLVQKVRVTPKYLLCKLNLFLPSMQINTAMVALFSCTGLLTNPATTRGLVVTQAVVNVAAIAHRSYLFTERGNGEVV